MTILTIINDNPADYDFNETISKTILNRYTRSLRRYIKKIYGW